MIKYKVALIHNIISPYRIPLFEELAQKENIELTVYFTAESENNRDWDIKNKIKFQYKVLPGFTLKFNNYYHVNVSIIKELLLNNYDVIISAGYSSFSNQIAFGVSKLLGIPFILWSGSTANEYNKWRRPALPLIKTIVKYSDGYISYGTNAKNYLISLGATEDKITISYNTVDIKYFEEHSLIYKSQKKELKEKFQLHHENIILYVGQLIDRKGIKYLLDAQRRLCDKHDVGIVLVGNGSGKSELIDYCSREKISNVYFIDFIQQEDLPQYYSIADIFVLPSIEEVWGLVINEAMACSLPIITTNKTGASTDLIIDGVNGYTIPEKNASALYNVLDLMLSDPKLIGEMGKSSNILINEKYTIYNAAERFVEAIELVCK